MDLDPQFWAQARETFLTKHKDSYHPERIQEFLSERISIADAKAACKAAQKTAKAEYNPALGNIFENIEIAMKVGDLAIKSAPESVGLAWTAVRTCLHAIQDDFATFSCFASSCSDIVGVIISVGAYGQMYSTPKGPESFQELHNQVVEFVPTIYADILEFSWAMRKHMQTNKALRWGKGIVFSSATKFKLLMEKVRNGETKMKNFAREATDRLSIHYHENQLQNQSIILNKLTVVQESLESYQKLNEVFAETIRQYEEKVKNMKKKTPLDLARNDFAENTKLLNPSSNQVAVLSSNLSRREDKTCTWIFQLEEYKSWTESADRGLTWVSGAGGFGKSILASTVVDHLEKESNKSYNTLVLYFFCHTGDEATSRTHRILQHILFDLYFNCQASLELLESANRIVSQYTKQLGGSPENDIEERTNATSFEETFKRLAELIGKTIYLVVDGIDECDDRQQYGLLKSLRMLEHGSGVAIKLLVSSRPESDIAAEMADALEIMVEKNNGPDIQRHISSELMKFPQWTARERDLAYREIAAKADNSFRYVELAISLFSQPWQRPIEKRLAELPEGLTDSYGQILEKTDPKYLELLRIALIWTILAKYKITVNEVMDAFNKRYVDDSSSSSECTSSEDLDETDELDANVALYIKQLRDAGSTFLQVDSETKVLSLRHTTVADYFLKEKIDPPAKSADEPCPTCGVKSSHPHSRPITFTKRNGHMEIAKVILRHLNSFQFCRTHGLVQSKGLDDQSQATRDETIEKDTNPQQRDSNLEPPEQHSELDPQDDELSTAGDDLGTRAENENDVDSETDSDAPRSDIDNRIDAAVPKEGFRGQRYEISQLIYHLQQVESLWCGEDRTQPEWLDFLDLLRNFFRADSEIYRAWLTIQLTSSALFNTPIVDSNVHPLHVAATFGLYGLAEMLIKQGADVTQKGSLGHQALHFAVNFQPDDDSQKELKFNTLKVLIEHGADVNSKAYRINPFSGLLRNEPELRLVQLFLTHDAQPDESEDKFDIPIHVYARVGDNLEVFKTLLDKVEIDVSDARGKTMLYRTLVRKKPNLDFLRELMSRGADVNQEGLDSSRPLQAAAMVGRADAIEMLLDAGADIHDDDIHGLTALHTAAKLGQEGACRVLIDRGAEIARLDKRGKTPFILACQSGSVGTAMLLLEASEKQGSTILNQASKKGKTPMWKAAHTGLVDIVELLLQKPGAAESIETPDSELQRTPLHAAAYSGQKSMVGLLLGHGAKLHSKDVAGNTPMMLCTQGWFATNSSKHEDTILMLLDEDSEVATTYPHLLHVSAMNGSEKVLNRLLDLGADPNKRDVHGWTAAQLAEQYENSHIVELLTNRKFAAARFHPTCWIETKSKYARVRRNGQMLEHLSPEKEVEGTYLQNDLVSFVSNHPAPPSTGTYYYEIEILRIKQKKLDKCFISFGFSHLPSKLTGWFPGSFNKNSPSTSSWMWFAYGAFFCHPDHHLFSKARMPSTFGLGDTVGCGIDFQQNIIFYTKNGVRADEAAFENVMGRVYPCIGLMDRALVRTNFGNDSKRPFKWNGV